MKKISEYLRDGLLTEVNFHQMGGAPEPSTLKITEWSSEFETLMRSRLIMGNFRYGPFRKCNRPTRAMMEAIINKANRYIGSGNDEDLVDIANLAMKEFVAGQHPKKHFNSIDDGKHV